MTVDAWNAATQQRERWIASQASWPRRCSSRRDCWKRRRPRSWRRRALVRHAPWLVANLQLDAALDERPGAPLSWDNVALRQRAASATSTPCTRARVPFAGPTVLTAYRALGGNDEPPSSRAQRSRLLRDDWRAWASGIVADLAVAHPDLPAQAQARRPHALRPRDEHSLAGRAQQRGAARTGRSRSGALHFAHADLSAYSVFEEAFFHGTRAGACGGRVGRSPEKVLSYSSCRDRVLNWLA